jgi:uncharacterized protein (TIGR02466 family)
MKKPKRIRRNSRQYKKQEDIQLETFLYFPTAIHAVNLPEFLDIGRKVSKDFLSEQKEEINDVYPVRMTGQIYNDERLKDFVDVVLDLGWNILSQQGYDMQHFRVILTEMWVQQHHKYSLMEHHVHGGDQLVGFYFLNAPKNGSKPIFYDPRPAKVITDLPLKPSTEINAATNIINFDATPGRMFITNSFLPHSFSKNISDEPTEFIHFNLKVVPYFKETSNVEIV